MHGTGVWNDGQWNKTSVIRAYLFLSLVLVSTWEHHFVQIDHKNDDDRSPSIWCILFDDLAVYQLLFNALCTLS
jgi:hypothetical protein